MKLSSLIHSRTGLAMVCAAAAFSGLVAVRAHADSWDKRTVLTVSDTIQVRETVLPPGKYVMKLYNSQAERHIVQIFNEDQSHLIDTVMAIPTQRMEPTGDTAFTFWETPAGHARAMRAWYYPGDTIGNEFPYPKNPKLLAMAIEPTPVPIVPAATTVSQPVETAQPDNQANEIENKAVVETPMPVETNKTAEEAAITPDPNSEQGAAQANDAQSASAPSSSPSSAASTRSDELPHTGSPYPLIGLAGALLLALAGLLRLTRTA